MSYLAYINSNLEPAPITAPPVEESAARVHVKRVRCGGTLVRESFTLLALDLPEGEQSAFPTFCALLGSPAPNSRYE